MSLVYSDWLKYDHITTKFSALCYVACIIKQYSIQGYRMGSESWTHDCASRTLENAIPVYHYCFAISRGTRNYWFRTRQGRSAEVVLVIRRRNGCYLVHTKAFYPPGSYRLMTGGVKPGEEPNSAALREAYEETGLQVVLIRALARIDYMFHYEDETLPFTSYLYLLQEQGGNLAVRDEDEEITGFHEIPLDDLPLLADQLEALQGDEWADWGRFRAPAHRIAYQLLEQENAPGN
jgi:8-oxo-dGTP pyrophosphatase MutT (NUDIX family)